MKVCINVMQKFVGNKLQLAHTIFCVTCTQNFMHVHTQTHTTQLYAYTHACTHRQTLAYMHALTQHAHAQMYKCTHIYTKVKPSTAVTNRSCGCLCNQAGTLSWCRTNPPGDKTCTSHIPHKRWCQYTLTCTILYITVVLYMS